LFLFLGTFLTLPVRCTVIPKMKIDIETRTDDTPKAVNPEPNLFRGHRDAKVVGAQKFNMKIGSTTTQTRLQSESDRFFSEAKEKSSKCNQEEERSFGGGEGVVYH
jgi:hypothetical protein